jgi:hypothetical protein
MQWLKTVLVEQYEFLQWTANDHLPHSTFVGLREDKKASDGPPRVRRPSSSRRPI